jgi:hypothetical protein
MLTAKITKAAEKIITELFTVVVLNAVTEAKATATRAISMIK